jgi:hypothetical protein
LKARAKRNFETSPGRHQTEVERFGVAQVDQVAALRR